MTHRENVLKKYGLPDKSYSLQELADITKVPYSVLKKVYLRGYGAAITNPLSVRMKGTFEKNVNAPPSMKLSKEQWAYARVYSFLDGSKKHDLDLRLL
jgi:hypothetical protein